MNYSIVNIYSHGRKSAKLRSLNEPIRVSILLLQLVSNRLSWHLAETENLILFVGPLILLPIIVFFWSNYYLIAFEKQPQHP